MAPVIDVTREALLSRRAAILVALGIDETELSNLTETRTISGDEWAAKEELDAIAFLLGEDAD